VKICSANFEKCLGLREQKENIPDFSNYMLFVPDHTSIWSFWLGISAALILIFYFMFHFCVGTLYYRLFIKTETWRYFMHTVVNLKMKKKQLLMYLVCSYSMGEKRNIMNKIKCTKSRPGRSLFLNNYFS
jgi:uncharacterized membrane protein (DUF106 family)